MDYTFHFLKNGEPIEPSAGQNLIMDVKVYSNCMGVIKEIIGEKTIEGISFHKIILMDEPDPHLDNLY